MGNFLANAFLWGFVKKRLSFQTPKAANWSLRTSLDIIRQGQFLRTRNWEVITYFFV